MASKLAVYGTGYDDERFEQIVSPSLHCIICTNVIKDPMACRHNEHLFCRACITKHLKNYQTCPSCMDPLTVDTLSLAPRTVTNLLAELRIRCDFFDRGCGKFIELGNLESHVRECGFAPAVCSNEGCELEVNKRDLFHHETAVCEQRRVKCHTCSNIRQEIDSMKINLAAMDEKLMKLDRNETNRKAVEENLVAKVALLQEQLNKQEESNRRREVELKKSLNEITKQLDKMTQQASVEVDAVQGHVVEEIAEATEEVEREQNVFVATGSNGESNSNSVEMFSLLNGTWTLLSPMREGRNGASSVVYNDQFIVMGGWVMSMEKLSLNAVQADQSITWENVPAELPGKLLGHCSVIYSGRLIVVGGFDSGKCVHLDTITEVFLVPPYGSKVLTTVQHRKCYHSVVLFGNVIVILGGRETGSVSSALSAVVMYDIHMNQFNVLAPLPYPVYEMATVKWGDDNIILMGGADIHGTPLNTVLIYNVKTQQSSSLPDMKYNRQGCVAAVVRDTVIVMGGLDEHGTCLKSVECFRFDRYTWKELPAMHEERWRATAVCN